MTLSYFRRHRTLFMVLMGLGVLGFVLFGTFPFVKQRLDTWLTPSPVAGTIDGREVKLTQVYDLYANLKIAAQAARYFEMILGQKVPEGEGQQRLLYLTRGKTSSYAWQAAAEREHPLENRMVWYAVYQEAKRLGFQTPRSQVTERLQDLRSLGLAPADFQRVLNQACGGDETRLEEALEQDMTIRAYEAWMRESLSEVVDPEVRREFARMDEQVKVRLAVLTAKDLEKEVKEATGEAIVKQFEAYRRYLPGEGPEGFGYKIPARVAIEYLVCDPKSFEAEARKTITEDEIKRYYDANKDPEFLVQEEKKEKADEKKPADEKKAGPEKDKAAEAEKKFRPLSEVRDQVVSALASQKARKPALEFLNNDVAEIRAKRRPDLDIWADKVHVEHVIVEGLHTAEQLAALKGIGESAREMVRESGRGKLAMPEYALSLAELLTDRAKARLAEGEISDVLTGPDGKAYAFRVTSHDVPHEAKSLAEVADRVKADLRLKAAYGLALERAQALEKAAQTQGLETAAKEAKIETAESEFFPREHIVPYSLFGQWMAIPPRLPKIGAVPKVVDACFRMAAEGKKLDRVELPLDRTVVVAELVDRKSPREAGYERMRPLLALHIGQQFEERAASELLSPKAVIARHKIIVDTANIGKGGRTHAPPLPEEELPE